MILINNSAPLGSSVVGVYSCSKVKSCVLTHVFDVHPDLVPGLPQPVLHLHHGGLAVPLVADHDVSLLRAPVYTHNMQIQYVLTYTTPVPQMYADIKH